MYIAVAIGAFRSEVQQGDVRYIGVSDWAAWQIAKRWVFQEQLHDNIGAAGIELNDSELATLDKVGALPAGHPGRMPERLGGARLRLLTDGTLNP